MFFHFVMTIRHFLCWLIYLPSITNDLPNELRKNAVDINHAKKMDINLDGMTEEWIIAFDTDHLFLVFPEHLLFSSKKIKYLRRNK